MTADGEQTRVSGRLEGHRSVVVDGTTVVLLIVSDGGVRRLLLPEADVPADLEPGRRYDVTAVRYSLPPAAAAQTNERCPTCQDPLREAVAVDGQSAPIRLAARQFDLAEPFYVGTDLTRINPRVEGRTDDWRPMGNDDPHRYTAPDFVCDTCGEIYDARDLHVPAEEHPIGGEELQIHHMVDNRQTVGLAAGGATDIGNFRANIEAGYTPTPGAITTEGLFAEYYFETGGQTAATDALFRPRYATGVSEHPLTGTQQHVLGVGLDSTLDTADFERPRLDLVAVLDVSGSMDAAFDAYYYDEDGRQRSATDADTTKIEAATRALCALTEQLHETDRLGVVLYNNRAHVAKPLREVAATDMDAIRGHIREVAAAGGTNMADGFEAARDLLQDAPADPDTERRIVFMTDMMPNRGVTGESALHERFAAAADEGIHTTFVGVGLDENADLATAIADVRGANHYFIHAPEEFERRLGAEFEYMVSPLVFDLQLELESETCEVAAVHGAPDGGPGLQQATTLFPSPSTEAETRGGIVLVELDVPDPDASVDLVVSWEERDGQTHTERVTVDLPSAGPSFDHDGLRKATALARLAETLQAWAEAVHDREPTDDWLLADGPTGQERESVPLRVPEPFDEQFATLHRYLQAELTHTGDEALEQELALLERLCAVAEVEVDRPSGDGSA